MTGWLCYLSRKCNRLLVSPSRSGHPIRLRYSTPTSSELASYVGAYPRQGWCAVRGACLGAVGAQKVRSFLHFPWLYHALRLARYIQGVCRCVCLYDGQLLFASWLLGFASGLGLIGKSRSPCQVLACERQNHRPLSSLCPLFSLPWFAAVSVCPSVPSSRTWNAEQGRSESVRQT